MKIHVSFGPGILKPANPRSSSPNNAVNQIGNKIYQNTVAPFFEKEIRKALRPVEQEINQEGGTVRITVSRVSPGKLQARVSTDEFSDQLASKMKSLLETAEID